MANQYPVFEFNGGVVALLEALSKRSPLSEPELAEAMAQTVDVSSLSVHDICQQLAAKRWIEAQGFGWVLSGDGARALADEGAASSTEQEDVGIPDHPLKPYDVAKLKVEQKPLSVFQALRKIEKGEIKLDPEFQRAFVWDDVRQSRLIESILIRIPLPAFYLDATDEVRWSVVDGLQRLTTLFRFCREESLALKGLEFIPELSGLRFSELPQKYRVLIEDDTQLIFNNLLPGTPVKAKFTIFSRVNTGGMQLTAQEIRHALQQGPVTKLLRTLAHSADFLTSTGGALESLRMTDREVVLRALSFMTFGYEVYKNFDDLNAFLVDSMEKFNGNYSESELTNLGEEFKRDVSGVFAIFGRYSFRKYYEEGGRRSPFNKALFEAWVAAVRNYPIDTLITHQAAIRQQFLKAMTSDAEFVKSITTSTGQSNAVKTRLTKVSEMLRVATNDQ